MKEARFTALARAELPAEVSYCENRGSGLGARFRAEVEAASELAVSSPKSGADLAQALEVLAQQSCCLKR